MSAPSKILSKTVPGLIVAALFPSCVSPKFEKAWKAVADGDRAGQRWEGRWQSERNTHGGRLRAVLKEPAHGRMEAFFEAGWHGFTTAYPVTLEAKQRGKRWDLSGEHHLRSFVGGGTYVYSGSMEAGRFLTRYTSSYDTGSFTLTPVDAPNASKTGVSPQPEQSPTSKTQEASHPFSHAKDPRSKL